MFGCRKTFVTPGISNTKRLKSFTTQKLIVLRIFALRNRYLLVYLNNYKKTENKYDFCQAAISFNFDIFS